MSKHVLIIDDDIDILEALRITLEDEGYQISTSANPDAIFKSFEKQLPDLIILDVLLSGNDGREVAKKIKTTPKTSKIPVILFSADNAAKKSINNAYVDDFISKPFDIDYLVQRIKKLT